MEPLSTLGIAAAGVQFIDFATKLRCQSVETYRSTSGQTERISSLKQLTDHLGALTSRLEEKAMELHVREDALPESPDAILLDNCRQCKEVSKELADTLQALSAGPSKFNIKSARSSLPAAIRRLMSLSKARDLTDKLQKFQPQMQMAALVSLWEKAQQDGKTIGETCQKQLDMIAKLNQVDETTRETAEYLQAFTGPSPGSTWRLSAELARLDAIVQDVWVVKRAPHLSHVHADGRDSVDHRREILHSLRFTSIQDREAAIPEAYPLTSKLLLRCSGSHPPPSSYSL